MSWSRMARAAFVAGTTLVSLAALATGASAQGMYYKEFKKDGRIYVFNDAKKAEAFEKSGETGTGLTRLGAGPNGETVFADNEQALDLFFFKNGIAQAVERPKSPTMKVEWRDGKTRITTDNAYLEISNRLQMRYTHELPDDSVQPAGTEAKGDSKGSFRIRRAKFKTEGWLFKPEFTFETQLNWPAVSGSNVGAFLEDAVLDWDASKKGSFRMRIGQFKVPFGHQELTSSGSQLFVDRAEVSNQYARGRDTGFAVWGVLPNGKVEYRAGIFNGNGLTRTTNDNDAFQYNARLAVQLAGAPSLKQRAWVSGPLYSEGDFESTDKPFLAIAANFEKNDFFRATTGTDLKDQIYGFDGTFKYKGVFATAEYYIRERTPETGAKFDSNGWFAQAAYNFGSGRSWALAGRYGMYDPTDARDDNNRKEWRAGISYFYSRHTLKVQADYGQLEDEAANSGKGTKNKELRFQAQVIF